MVHMQVGRWIRGRRRLGLALCRLLKPRRLQRRSLGTIPITKALAVQKQRRLRMPLIEPLRESSSICSVQIHSMTIPSTLNHLLREACNS